MHQRSTHVVKANCEVIGREVKNNNDEHLGKVKELVLEKVSGNVVYVVLHSDGFMGMGGKCFALPWNILHFDDDKNCFRVDINKERLSNAPGFDKDNWPDMADSTFRQSIADFYGIKPPENRK